MKAVAAATAVVALTAAAIIYGLYGSDIRRWGCPSQEEVARPRSPDEVTDVFAREGLVLERISWPAELRRARSYLGATVLRHEAPGVTLTLVVCRAHCETPGSQVRSGRPRRQVRFGFSTANVAGSIWGTNREADAALREPLYRAVDGLGTTVDPDSRCYVG